MFGGENYGVVEGIGGEGGRKGQCGDKAALGDTPLCPEASCVCCNKSLLRFAAKHHHAF